MFITTFAQNYSQNAGNAISKTQKFKKSREGNRMPPDTQRNARLQVNSDFFLLLANTLNRFLYNKLEAILFEEMRRIDLLREIVKYTASLL
jgi:hypothetical protein